MRTRVFGPSLPALLLALITTSVLAQPTQRPLAAAPFALWIGEWRGAGWSIGANGQRAEFTLSESVKEKAGATVLFVEGHGKRSDGTVSHDGVVFVSRDNSGKLRWQGHEAATGAIDAEIRMRDNGFEWSIEPDKRGTTVRFVIALEAKRWTEIAEVSTDGKTWTRFMEMSLLRQ